MAAEAAEAWWLPERTWKESSWGIGDSNPSDPAKPSTYAGWTPSLLCEGSAMLASAECTVGSGPARAASRRATSELYSRGNIAESAPLANTKTWPVGERTTMLMIRRVDEKGWVWISPQVSTCPITSRTSLLPWRPMNPKPMARAASKSARSSGLVER